MFRAQSPGARKGSLLSGQATECCFKVEGAFITESSLVLVNGLCGQLPASPVRFRPSPAESHDLDGKGPCYW